jgi:hypothetical protein
VALAIAWVRALPAAPIVCASVNLSAALVMKLVLTPATPLVADPATASAYVRSHLLAWRLGWSIWILAALSLLWFYVWWRERIGASSFPVVIAVIGFVADVTSEIMLILYSEATASFAFTLTGVVANGLYTICGIWLTVATRLTVPERIWTGLMWAAGITLSVGTLFGAYVIAAVATAVLFALFCPWCVYLAVKLR